MRSWSNSNPEKRKTRKGVKRFVNSWLSKAQNSGSQAQGRTTVKNNNNFERRKYDFEALESELIG